MMRALNMALRTAHIGAMGVLLGGIAFDVSPGRLEGSLWLTVGTGVALAVVEAGPDLSWFHEGRGLLTLAKLAMLGAALLVRDSRLPILLAVVVIASVGSHMPGRFRHWSVLYRRVIHEASGPRGRRTREEGTGAGE